MGNGNGSMLVASLDGGEGDRIRDSDTNISYSGPAIVRSSTVTQVPGNWEGSEE